VRDDTDPAYPGAEPVSISGTVRTAADYILKNPGSKIKLKVFPRIENFVDNFIIK
jgi:hypothetical protein